MMGILGKALLGRSLRFLRIRVSTFENHFSCHSEGATRSGFMTEKNFFPEMLLEIPATEDSLVSSRHLLSVRTGSGKIDKPYLRKQEILRRPGIPCRIIDGNAGLAYSE
jgi:hypothetical protein